MFANPKVIFLQVTPGSDSSEGELLFSTLLSAKTCSDSGFGHALSKYLDKLGFTVFAGVLNEGGPGAEELRRTCSMRLSVLQLDITKPQQIKDAHSKVMEKVQNRVSLSKTSAFVQLQTLLPQNIKLKGLWAVVNNAGIFSYPADGELTPMTEYKRCMAVNFFGTVEVTKAFLPLLRKSKGRLVNISSLADITGTSDMWDKLEKSILDHLPPDVQEDYGQDYIHRQRGYLRLINNFSDPNISPVLLDIHHAISAKSPCAFYAPGKMTYPWIYFVSFSPTGIFDYFAKKKHGHGKIMPRALSKPNVKNEAI
ncbi:estradiol 17-beta-dehydrogenase 2 [Camelus ferus]|nr:estradiol 17-beta-dehydrogenase 2 [Camelus ferus]